MIIELISRALISDGREVLLTLEAKKEDKRDSQKFILPRAIFDELALPVPPAEISRETALEISYADEQYKAIKKSFELLAYGRNSEKTLTTKLRSRGFSPEIAADAAAYMKKNGYIKEGEDAVREAECCVEKLWGVRRILMHLHEKGYDGEALEEAKAYLETVDFVELCVRLIRAKYKTLPKEEKEHQRVVSGLVRYGYSFSEIKAAAKIVEHYSLPGDI